MRVVTGLKKEMGSLKVKEKVTAKQLEKEKVMAILVYKAPLTWTEATPLANQATGLVN